ncbi:MAG: MarR family winged helix-turn-helix transcriptional regulator [Pseudobdellovibrionaceae bacterium]
MLPILFFGRDLERVLNDRLRPFEINWTGASLLVAIFFEERACGFTEVTKTFGIKRARMSQLVKQLETSGWVERRTELKNARSKMLSLTPAGKKICSKIVGIFNNVTDQLEEDFGKEKAEEISFLLKKSKL